MQVKEMLERETLPLLFFGFHAFLGDAEWFGDMVEVLTEYGICRVMFPSHLSHLSHRSPITHHIYHIANTSLSESKLPAMADIWTN